MNEFRDRNGVLASLQGTSLPAHLHPANQARYTEDITVAGSLLRDKLTTLVDKVKGVESDGPYLKVDKVQLVDRWGAEPNIVGTLHVTTSHVIFKAEDDSKEIWLACGLIGVVERGPLSAAGCPLVIRCKHFMQIHLIINRDKICQDLYTTLMSCSRPTNIENVFAFENRDSCEDLRGWSRLEWDVEFTRQGVGEEWHETTINKEYSVCDTYPERLWVPSAAHAATLEGACRFRSRGRLPALTYYHRNNGAVIARCAQPMTGFRARCVEDETLMHLVGKANPQNHQVYLVDTRPVVNAMVNKVQGKGFEDERNYSNIRSFFFDIENIHVMRSSQQKLLEGCHRCRAMSDYLRAVESSGWLKHLRAVVECGLFIAMSVAQGVSCVVHCSDGWDRTSQTVSIAEILLDPFYRTIHGFQVLIEKDWLAFGHKFDDRCAHVGANNEEAPKEISPIFSQFLDCIWQLWRMRPSAFQFNERYLVEIHEHVYSCQYGTFLGNCDSDRKSLHLATRTKSLWTFLDSRQDDFINPFYEPTSFGSLLDIDIRPYSFVVWTGLYNRFDGGVLPREDIYQTAMTSMEHIGVLEAHVAQLRLKLADLKQHLGLSTMADSGHCSSNGGDMERSESLAEQQSRSSVSMIEESGYCEDVTPQLSIRWQSLREAESCAAKGCRFEFPTRGDRRTHCHRCGLIFCRRCVHPSGDQHERVCVDCKAAASA